MLTPNPKGRIDKIDPKPGERIVLSGWIGSSKAHAVSRLAASLGRPALLVVDSMKEALRWEDDLSLFLPSYLRSFLFPAFDVLPYFNLSPNPDIPFDQAAAAFRLLQANHRGVTIVPLQALVRKMMPRPLFEKKVVVVSKGETSDRDAVVRRVASLGYERFPIVDDRGSFAVRGGIVDLFSPVYDQPARIEFFGDTVESIRLFDPKTQKSTEEISLLVIPPARQILFEDLEKEWPSSLKTLSDRADMPKPDREKVREAVDQKIRFAGIESFLPFFYPEPGTLFDYLAPQTLLFFTDYDQQMGEMKNFLKTLARHREESKSPERLFAPEELFLTPEALAEWTGLFSTLDFSEISPESSILNIQSSIFNASMESNRFLQAKIHHGKDPARTLTPLAIELREKREAGISTSLVASSRAQLMRLKDLLLPYDLPLKTFEDESAVKKWIHTLQTAPPENPEIILLCGHLTEGFLWPENFQWWISDAEIFGQKMRKAKVRPVGEVFSSFDQMKEGDFVVHQDHGVGHYRGLLPLSIQGIQNDFLLIEYLGGDRLYVPVHQLSRLYRYASQEGGHPVIDRLGGTSWSKVRERVRRAARRLARELLHLQAVRNASQGFAYSSGGSLIEEFEATFPYEETDDQLRTITEVFSDMEKAKPMDRVVCGDVGYGKTEVAIRAAFKAILDQRQVAVLVPTTVLAFQHAETFTRRLTDYAVRVEMLSRFQTVREQQKVLKGMADGTVDIVVGTHRLLSKDIVFANLGLLVIDEEHRFGVAQKEKIKKLRATVDVLTLSATPIPRTLNFAMTGIRDLSVIKTPPEDRLAIRTYVTKFDDTTVREAILHEIRRGGQVFFVHNRVQTIDAMRERLRKIVPEAAIGVAHGQMKEEKLEQVMVDFMERRFNLLLCSAIIESGLDIPSANTMIVNRADHFGLAQLYQLRGRIGRSFHRAFCYLLIPDETLMTEDARKRLSVIQRFGELGAGFRIASHDLEIRGAGNILGSEQSGHIAAIGYDLYVKLLEQAVSEMKGEALEEEIDPDLKLPVAAYLPEGLVPDTQLRLALYKKLSQLRSSSECDSLHDEWIDRFGVLPKEAEDLIALMRVKIAARNLKVSQISAHRDTLTFQIHPKSPIPTDYFLGKVQSSPKRFKILPDGKFVVREKEQKDAPPLKTVSKYLEEMRLSLKMSDAKL